MEVKNFVIYASNHLGETLVLSELIYNIRAFYKSVNICLVVYPQWEYVANLIEGIDKIVVLKKKSVHKGLKGVFNLKKEIGYKNIYASFITFRRQRPIFIANMLNSKYILFNDINFFFDTFLRRSRYKIISEKDVFISRDVTNLLSGILQEKFIHIPIKLNSEKIVEIKTEFVPSEYIAINPIGNGDYKCMSIEQLADIISVFNKHNQKVMVLGNGEKAQKYSDALKQFNIDYLDLINKTDVKELVYIIKNIKSIVSVDTGTAHLATYLGKKTLWISHKQPWVPDEIYENSANVPLTSSAETIYEEMIKML